MGIGTLKLRQFSKSGLWAVPIYAVIVVLITLFVYRPLDNIAQDLLLNTVSPFNKPANDIVIVTITEDALRQFPYRSPIDRGFISELISTISKGGPRVIAIDILFDQPTETVKDQKLASTIRSLAVPFIVASIDVNDGLSAQQVEYLNNFVPEANRASARLARDPTDGIIRQLFVGQKSGGKFIQGFAATVASVSGAKVEAVEQLDMVYYLDADSKPFKFPTYPANAISLVPLDWFADKIVLIGVDLSFEDRHLTPFAVLNGTRDGSLPGVVVHAHGISQLLNGDQIIRAGVPESAAVVLIILLLATWLILMPVPTLLKPLIALSSLVIFWAIAALLFSNFRILMPVAVPSITLLSIASLVAFFAWKRDLHVKGLIEQAFSQYVNPTIVQTIIDQPATLKLGGERRHITCICTDVQDFTQFSENLEPEQVATALNQYFSKICELFAEYEATIDKLVGDFVVGFFGAPISQSHQADRAIGLALAIDRFSEQFRKQMNDSGQTFGATRIGVHSGPAIVGNFGGEKFFDYTAIGDTVNTAARLEGANKSLGTRICISKTVASGAAETRKLRPSANIRLIGKAESLKVFEPLHPQDISSDVLDRYLEAYEAMRSGNAKSKELFERLGELAPADRLITYHCKRLQAGASDDNVLLEVK